MRIAGLAVVMLWAAALPAAADEKPVPRGDVFAGYSYTRADEESLNGVEASFGWNFGRRLALVADASRHFATVEGTDLGQTMLLAGPRLSFRGQSLTVFVHALGGYVKQTAGFSVLGVTIEESDSGLGGAFGGGVDLKVGARLAVRAQGDLTVVKGDVDTTTEPRLSAGLVLRFGHR